jgi:aminocarboxymuconate-semialdehyde decarboxylase
VTTLAAGSLVLGGALDRFPGLEIVLVHGGGFLPYHIGRFDRGHAVRPEVRADGAALLVQVVGADRVLLGSDHPFWLGDPEPTRVVREAGLPSGVQAAILGDNAARLFHLGEPAKEVRGR